MRMGKGSMFALGPPPAEEDDEDDMSDYAGDLDMSDMSSEEDAEGSGGPFDDYAQTLFDTEADPATRTDALRQAILTVLEEKGQA